MRRFFYTRSKRGKTLHILYGKRVEDEATACGRRIHAKDWWFTHRSRGMKVCKGCRKAS